MKRVFTICIALLMAFSCMPLSARAESESVTIAVTADKTTVNPGDKVNFEVVLGAINELGGLEFNLVIPEGLTMDYDSIAMQEGLKDVLKSDGDIIKPTELNGLKWSYSVGSEGYTSSTNQSILSFSCTVDAEAALGTMNITLVIQQCFDSSLDYNDFNVNLIPAVLTVEKARIPVAGIALNQAVLTMKDGETVKLTATITPANADNQNMSWTSGNTAVATVSADGTVTAVKDGKTSITVTTEDGGKTATCAVTVNCNHTMSKTEAIEPTCEEDGNVEYYVCGKCGKKYADEAGTKELTDVVQKAKGHQANAWQKDETGHWKICTTCGKEFDKGGHAYRWVVDKAATEDETGLQHEECVCGARRGENTVIAKLDHVHTGISHHEAVAANCITEGSLEYWTCSSEKCKGKYYGDANCQTVIENVTIPVNPENHVGTGKWDKDADKHVYTCSCGKVLIEGKHQYSDDTDSDCNECGYKRFYLVTGGANAAYERGTEAGLTITADGDVKLLKAVEVDRKIIDESNYEVKAGSTIITLKKSYLDTLSAVTHDIRILYTDGKAATTQFTIKETNVNGNGNTNGAQNGQTANESNAAETQNGHISPQTGEENHSVLWIALAMSAVSAIMVFSWYRWKKLRK